MTPRTWAEKRLDRLPMAIGSDSVSAKEAAKLLHAEHARSVRVVKREIANLNKLIAADELKGNMDDKTIHAYACATLEDLLDALQRGRSQGGKG